MKLVKLEMKGSMVIATLEANDGQVASWVLQKQSGETLADAACRIEEALRNLALGLVKPSDLAM